MKILIQSRKEIEEMAEQPFPAHSALISITDHGWSFARLVHKPEYLLQVAFDDVDHDVILDELGRQPTEEERKSLEIKYKMFSDEQAEQVAAFYHAHKDAIEVLICQCEHGQSRSAAVAAAILELRSRKGIVVFASDRYYPNKVVFKKTLVALRSMEARPAYIDRD